ncbi:tetratricopeptide repeat-containing sulfotransferase family protein [Coralloluteibacterium stylophorae]|uniref:Sulfotransferase n=1 Tax=Coralloluteibacterium stylophorae TaxID=1776034 RepID=A0A8J7VUY1_9GAMM|nr:sulfotransferase [Coralloluteibacterium stylophorae]MBS7456293.1 sulfotransferase [Coralloluteibacterium stylophorae]
MLESIVAAQPDDARAWLQLSYVESWLGGHRAARSAVLQAHALAPTDPERLVELASRLRTFNLIPELHALVARLPPPERLPIPVLLGLAAVLSYINDQTGALRLLDEAVRADPDYPPSRVSRAQVLGYFGRNKEAARDLEACLARAPGLAQAHWHRSRLRRQSAERNHVRELEVQLGRVPRGSDEEALLAFALHKECDDIGRTEQAWAALERGCRAKRARLPYSAAESRTLVDGLVARCDAAFMAAEDAAAPAADAVVPVFIVGMHRSGTTLLERILAGHSAVHDAGELYDFTAQMRLATDHHCRGPIDGEIVARAGSVDYTVVGAGYLAGLDWRRNGRRFVSDKLPSNFLNLGFIRRALPQARILHMTRDPMDTCFSNLRELFSDACAYSYDQAELADYFLQYRRLMAHWHAVMPGAILDVGYADLVAEPEAAARRILAFCGLDYEPGVIRIEEAGGAVATASSPQIHGGIHRRGFGAWRRYERQLEPLRRALGDAAPQ